MTATYRTIAAHELDAALLGTWRTIQSGNDAFASPYFCPEFTQIVGEVRGDVRVVVIENDNRIAGFFPYQQSVFGMGNPVGGALSDFHGVIAEPDAEWEIEPLLRAAKLSVWRFTHLVDITQKFKPHFEVQAASPQIDLREGYERYVDGRRDAGSDYIRKTEGLARKLARDIGEPRFTLNATDSTVLGKVFEWKSLQFRRASLPDAFSLAWTGKLLRRIAALQTPEFSGICSALHVRDRIVAAHIGMRSRNTFHYWFPTYDSEFAKFSPGIILLLRMAQSLAGAGVKTIDLGTGESQYKQRLMTGFVPLYEGAVELPSILASARSLRRLAEQRASRGGVGMLLKIPLGLIRRTERLLKFR